MYANSCPCDNGLGFITELATAAVSAFASGGSSGSGAGTPAGAPITVSPEITAQISPQISPVFQQQFQPQNSAATAGTAQSLPGMQPVGTGIGVPGYAQPLTPSVPQVGQDWSKYMPYALAGLGILAFVALKKRKA